MSAVLTPGDAAHTHGNAGDDHYEAFLARMNARFSAIAAERGALFTTNAEGLWETYLGHFAPHDQQYHNCNACRHFIERFGGLVFIDDNGVTTPAMWNGGEADIDCAPSIIAMQYAVGRAEVTGVFLSSEKTLGQPVTGIWRHLSATLPAAMVHKHPLLTAGQSMAEKREDYRNMQRAIGDFTGDQVDQALQLLNSDALYRSEKVIGPAQFLRDLIAVRDDNRNNATRRNLTWRRIAAAPAGFCHPRSSMIGSLLEDIAAGLDFGDVSRKFAAKMHPLAYQRPQAAPKAGNIAQAEKMFEELGLAPALERRIARIDEIPLLWSPKKADASVAGGIFGHLKTRGEVETPSLNVPALTMTLDKFHRTVMPTAEEMQVSLAHSVPAIFITAPMNSDAPRLFQWNHAFSHYVWNGGTPPTALGLRPGWIDVAGITRLPGRWDEGVDFEHRGDGIILLLAGARESRLSGNALFPEQMRSELHQVRSVIEAFSRSARMQGLADGTAIGYDLRKGGGASSYPATVRVKSAGRWQAYKIDRWD